MCGHISVGHLKTSAGTKIVARVATQEVLLDREEAIALKHAIQRAIKKWPTEERDS